jgi:hypothetical protein
MSNSNSSLSLHQRLIRLGQEIIDLGLFVKAEGITSLQTVSSANPVATVTAPVNVLPRSVKVVGVSKTKTNKYEARLYDPRDKVRHYLGSYTSSILAESAIAIKAKDLGIPVPTRPV